MEWENTPEVLEHRGSSRPGRRRRRGGRHGRARHRRDHRHARHQLFHRHQSRGADRRRGDGRRQSARRRAPHAGDAAGRAVGRRRPHASLVRQSSAGPRRSGRKCCRRRRACNTRSRRWCIYDGATRSGCGGAQAAMGPFYCPIDKKVYLDTSFFRDMKTKYGGGGDFAYAYVIAHEVGHHVQDLLGILDKVDNVQAAGRARPRPTRSRSASSCRPTASPASGPTNANEKWKILEPGDIEKALATAAGDRRRPPADRRARLRRARQLHPRLLGDARRNG